MANNFLKRGTNQVGEATVGGADFAVEGDGNQDVVEGVDQVAIALLGALNDREKFVELLVAGRRTVTLLNAADQPTEFGYFMVALPGINDE